MEYIIYSQWNHKYIVHNVHGGTLTKSVGIYINVTQMLI
jgi:hypothetical protein